MTSPHSIIESCCLSTSKPCFWVAGVQISYLAAASVPAGNPDFLEHFVPPGAGPPFYLHENRTDAFYVLQGEFRFRCGANDALVTAGQFLMFPPGLPHLYENVGLNWGRLLNVITPGGLQPLYLDLHNASRNARMSFRDFFETTARYGVALQTASPDDDSDGIVAPEKWS